MFSGVAEKVAEIWISESLLFSVLSIFAFSSSLSSVLLITSTSIAFGLSLSLLTVSLDPFLFSLSITSPSTFSLLLDSLSSKELLSALANLFSPFKIAGLFEEAALSLFSSIDFVLASSLLSSFFSSICPSLFFLTVTFAFKTSRSGFFSLSVKSKSKFSLLSSLSIISGLFITSLFVKEISCFVIGSNEVV